MSFVKSNSSTLLASAVLGIAGLALFLLSAPSFALAQMAPPASPVDDISPLPASGGAPLDVMFNVTARVCAMGAVAEGTFRVNFGDGSTHQFSGCPNGARITHTYNTSGTYTARLQHRSTAPGSSWTNLKSASITVGHTLTVRTPGTTAYDVAITANPATYGGTTNYSRRDIPHNTSITLTAPATVPGARFVSWSGCNSTNANNRTCVVNMNESKTVDANYQATSISSDPTLTVSPASVRVGGTVSFRARQTCPSGQVSEGTYRINYGDGNTSDAFSMCSDRTFNHSYTSAGTYNARLQQRSTAPGSSWSNVSNTGTSVVVTTGQPSSSALSASPSSGTSPLTVTFSHGVTGQVPGPVIMHFGDGNTRTAPLCTDAPFDACLTPATFNYTYTSAGTYTARLVGGGNIEYGRVTITVRSTTPASNSLTASPSSGRAPLVVTFSHNVPGNVAGPWKLEFGDGNSATANPCFAPADACVTPGTNTYTYTSAGTYNARLLNNSGSVVARTTVTVSRSQSGDTDDDLRQQLIALIQALLQQLQARGVSVSLSGGGSVATGMCVNITSPLYIGASDSNTGGDVSRLQQFLRSTGDFTYPEITGFYGQSTMQAVQRWQARNNIVSSGTPESTGFGLVGSMTRSAMACR